MDKDRVKGKIDDIKGRAKRQVGEWTGDKDAQAEGLMDQAKGKVENAFGKLKDAGRDLRDRAEHEGRAERDRIEHKDRDKDAA